LFFLFLDFAVGWFSGGVVWFPGQQSRILLLAALGAALERKQVDKIARFSVESASLSM
jgi:hypothetical protein